MTEAHVRLLTDAASRPAEAAAVVLRGIDDATLHAMPQGGSSIAWLIWHAARQMDVQLAALTGEDQVWETGRWADRLGVQRGPDSFGFGDSTDDVASLRISEPADLGAYVSATVERLQAYVAQLRGSDLDDIVDTSYTPHVTRGVRLVSIIDDAVAHVAQAAYVRGIVDGWTIGY